MIYANIILSLILFILFLLFALISKAIKWYECYLSVKDPNFKIRANQLFKNKYNSPKISSLIDFKKKKAK